MNVPKLRFPEFEGEWEDVALDQMVGKKISYGIVQAGPHIPDGMPYIKSKDLNQPLEIDFLERTSDEIAKSYRRSEVCPGDIIFSLRGNIGVSQIVPSLIPVANLTQGTARISVKRNVSNVYIQTALQTSKSEKRILAVSKGSTFQEISLFELRQIRLGLPTFPEQKKIATFLGVVDDKIAALRDRQAGLERYKRGLMQVLFSQSLRFTKPDGAPFPAWEEKRLGEAVRSIESGLALDQNLEGKGIPVTRIETISEAVVNHKKVGYVDTNSDVSPYRLEKGDLLFSNINSVKHIGKIAQFQGESELFHGMNLLRIRPDQLKVNSNFLYFLLISLPLKQHFERVCNQAVNQASINQTELKKTKIPIPFPEEQQKIADALSAMDTKIQAVAGQVAQMQTFKKGLLQQMFV